MKINEIAFEEKKTFNWLDVPIGILFSILFISVGLAIAINFRPLYYANISWLDLEATSGIPASIIKENYAALIDYCSPFYFGDLVFPSLPSSASAISHFAEVKVMFNVIYIAGAISLIACSIIVYFKARAGEYRYLLVSAVTALIPPAIVGIACAVYFEGTFELFHRLFFRNDDWLFNYITDPIILLLPKGYFLQCALLIVFVVLLGCLALFLRYRHDKKNQREETLIPVKKNYYY